MYSLSMAKRERYHGTKLAQYHVSAPQLIFAILALRKGGGGRSDGTLRYIHVHCIYYTCTCIYNMYMHVLYMYIVCST